MEVDSGVGLPYFDYLFDLLKRGNQSAIETFGRHLHWGYWTVPPRGPVTDADYAAAAERLTDELCTLAGTGSGQAILDAGCGFGGTLAHLNDRHSDAVLVGLNIDRRQLARARDLLVARSNNRVDLILGDASKLPVGDRTFDRVLAVECIFHFPSREDFFREAWRTLKPGGVLALSDFVSAPWFVPLARFMDTSPAFGRWRYFGRCNVEYTDARYRSLAQAVGFEPLARRDITRQTLPTYRHLAQLIRRAGPAAGIDDRRMAFVVDFMWLLAFSRSLKYGLLAFQKPTTA